MIYSYIAASIAIVSLLSLVGVFFLSMKEDRLQRILLLLVGLSVGALFGDAFFHLLPEGYENLGGKTTAVGVSAGILIFFAFEKYFRWHHHHHVEETGCEHCEEDIAREPSRKHIGYLSLLVDSVHNFIDGLIIAASFLASVPLGIATTIAVCLHEIPQEIGHFGLLVHFGFERKKALLLNLFSAAVSALGAVVAVLMAGYASDLPMQILPLAAGGFIYVAGTDLVPELHSRNEIGNSFKQFFSILLGFLAMYLLLLVEF